MVFMIDPHLFVNGSTSINESEPILFVPLCGYSPMSNRGQGAPKYRKSLCAEGTEAFEIIVDARPGSLPFGALLLVFLDHFFLDVARYRLVLLEFHGELALALCGRAKIG